MVNPAVIAAGASLLGGILGRNSEKKAIAAQNEYNKPVNIRARAEEAGFNPLLFVGAGVGQQTATGGSNIMGSAIANAGLALADGMDKEKMLEIERARLAMDREKLDALLNNATIRPKVGGIYAQRVQAPSGADLGGRNYRAPAAGLAPPRRPSLNDERVPVIYPDNSIKTIPKKWADRLKIGAMDALIVEDFEALGGDEGGQVLALPQMPAVGHQLQGEGKKGTLVDAVTHPFDYLGNKTGLGVTVGGRTVGNTKRPPKEKRYDLRSWPSKGWSFTDPAYLER